MIIKPLLIVFLIPLVVIKDLIPLIDSQYRTIPKRNYRAIGKIMVDFEHEMVAKNEIFEFETTIEFKKTE